MALLGTICRTAQSPLGPLEYEIIAPGLRNFLSCTQTLLARHMRDFTTEVIGDHCATESATRAIKSCVTEGGALCTMTCQEYYKMIGRYIQYESLTHQKARALFQDLLEVPITCNTEKDCVGDYKPLESASTRLNGLSLMISLKPIYKLIGTVYGAADVSEGCLADRFTKVISARLDDWQALTASDDLLTLVRSPLQDGRVVQYQLILFDLSVLNKGKMTSTTLAKAANQIFRLLQSRVGKPITAYGYYLYSAELCLDINCKNVTSRFAETKNITADCENHKKLCDSGCAGGVPRKRNSAIRNAVGGIVVLLLSLVQSTQLL